MKITGFVIAIRFNRSFSIVDNFGAIMDKILYDSDDVFSNKLFTDCQTFVDARVLTDKEGNNKITINSENFILDITDSNDVEKKFKESVDAFQRIIGDYLFDKYDIRKINRFGCVIKAELEKSDKLFTNVINIIAKDKNEPDSLSLRFNCAQNKPKEIKGTITGDYENEIFTYNRDKKGSPVTFLVDYQYYFRPSLNKLSDTKLKFSTFCNNSISKFKKDYLEK